MIKWKHPHLINDFTIIHSNKIKKMDNGYFEIVKMFNEIKVFVREAGDFRLDDGLHSIENAKALCKDFLLKVKI